VGWNLVIGWRIGCGPGRIGLVQALHNFIENFWTGAGDGFTGMGAGFDPRKEEDERYPAARIVFEFRTDSVEDPREAEREVDGDGLQRGRIEAVLGRRCNEILAADERADWVNGAGLVYKEGAGDSLVEVVEA
jgi:hypothetical protein